MEQIKIGNQTWSSKILDVDTFRNGDPILHAVTEEEWKQAGENKTPAWCYYDNDPAKGETYGKLYNWYAVSDPRGLAPEGWHVPSDGEWEILTDHLGGKVIAGSQMKSTSGWDDYDDGEDDDDDGESGNGNNESGFSGLPGGFCYVNGPFFGIGKNGFWWSSTEFDTDYARCRYLSYYDGDVSRDYQNKGKGISVRCLRD